MSRSKGVALITGSAQGIGRAIAIRLAQDGFDLALNDLPGKKEVLEDFAAELRRGGESESSYHPRTCIVTCDVSKEDEVKSMIDTTVDALGSLDVMIANAGISGMVDLLSETLEGWDRMMKINGTSAFLCYKYAAIQMVKQGRGGRIIGASSMVGIQATSPLMSYSASKFAVRAITQAAALQLGQYGITVNSYAPGIIATPMVVASKSQIAKRGDKVDYFQKVRRGLLPLERARTARGTKARPLWREATALSIEDRLRHTRGLPTTSQDSCHRARTPATPVLSCQSAPLHMPPLQMQPSAVAQRKTNVRECGNLRQTTTLVHLPPLQMQPSAVVPRTTNVWPQSENDENAAAERDGEVFDTGK
ncbi:hypothetical protein EV424DRAFT_1542860 [Suillus variegatus]|nr:hypothetical protein EV424DRAFT_1542860 [Suillus variegatus]